MAAPGLQEELRKALDDFISQNKIVLFMKGTQQVLHRAGLEHPTCNNTTYAYLAILQRPRLCRSLQRFQAAPWRNDLLDGGVLAALAGRALMGSCQPRPTPVLHACDSRRQDTCAEIHAQLRSSRSRR